MPSKVMAHVVSREYTSGGMQTRYRYYPLDVVRPLSGRATVHWRCPECSRTMPLSVDCVDKVVRRRLAFRLSGIAATLSGFPVVVGGIALTAISPSFGELLDSMPIWLAMPLLFVVVALGFVGVGLLFLARRWDGVRIPRKYRGIAVGHFVTDRDAGLVA
jgi:hypothetical protein